MTSSRGRCAVAACSVQHLPAELLGHIFNFINVRDKAQVSATSLSGRLKGSRPPSCSEVLRKEIMEHDADCLRMLEPAC